MTELMVTIVIVGILAAVGFAALASPGHERALRGTSALVTGTVQELRAWAMSSGRAAVVRFEEGPLGGGAERARMVWWTSFDNTCSNLPGTALGQIVFTHTSFGGDTRHVTITEVAPTTAANTLTLCITPTGRIVDPLTARPLAAIGDSDYAGQALVELRPALCRGANCSPAPYRRIIEMNFNGLTAALPRSAEMP
jgi:type II secretory pathway pseudopilin PulG